MPMKNLGKPNLSANLKTGFKPGLRGVARGAMVQKPSVKGAVASNHPHSSRAAMSGGRKKTKMY